MKSAMLVINIVDRGGAVDFWDVRDARKQGGPNKREDQVIKGSLPSYIEPEGIPLDQLTNRYWTKNTYMKTIFELLKENGIHQKSQCMTLSVVKLEVVSNILEDFPDLRYFILSQR